MHLAAFDANLNHIAASCIGETLSLYVNGEFIVSVEDSSLDSGDARLDVGTYDVPPVTVRFDNFIAYTPLHARRCLTRGGRLGTFSRQPEWRNRQTRTTQNRVPSVCGFDPTFGM